MDKELLEYLATDARIHTTKLAKILKLDRHIVEYRRRRLEKKKYINGYTLNINFKALGFREFIIYFNINNYFQRSEEIKIKLNSNPSISWVAEILSSYNLRCTFLVRTQEELESAIQDVENFLANDLIKMKIVESTDVIKKLRYSTIKLPHMPYTGYMIDQKDKALLLYLAKEPVAPYLKIAKAIGKNIEFVRQRIKKLIENGIIQQIEANVNLMKLGLAFQANLFVYLNNFDKHQEDLIALLYSDIGFGRTRKLFGDWNLEITFLVSSHFEIDRLLKKLIRKFKSDFTVIDLFIYTNRVFTKNHVQMILGDHQDKVISHYN